MKVTRFSSPSDALDHAHDAVYDVLARNSDESDSAEDELIRRGDAIDAINALYEFITPY